MGVAEVEDEEKDSRSHLEASASGVGELRNTSNRGAHDSISAGVSYVSARTRNAGRESLRSPR